MENDEIDVASTSQNIQSDSTENSQSQIDKDLDIVIADYTKDELRSYIQRELDYFKAFNGTSKDTRQFFSSVSSKIEDFCFEMLSSHWELSNNDSLVKLIAKVLNRLLRKMPIKYLTDSSVEWVADLNTPELYRNIRCPSVYKSYRADQFRYVAYNERAILFKDVTHGSESVPFVHHNIDGYSSRQDIRRFPMYPKSIIVTVYQIDDGHYTLLGEEQLEEVWKYYCHPDEEAEDKYRNKRFDYKAKMELENDLHYNYNNSEL